MVVGVDLKGGLSGLVEFFELILKMCKYMWFLCFIGFFVFDKVVKE